MRTRASGSPMLLVLVAGLVFGSVACRESAGQPFAGTWVMRLDDRPFVVLTLERSGDGFTGTLVRPERMSTDGLSVSEISGEVVDAPVTAAVRDPATLRVIAGRPDDPAGTTEFEFTLRSPDDAGMKPAGVPFEAWPLRRHDATGAPTVWTGWDRARSYPIQLPPVTPNAVMAAIYREDQEVRQSLDAFDAEAERIAQDDAVRRKRTRALLEAGELQAGEDFRLAALVFQHGSEPQDYLFAHTLALVALAKGDRSAAWIAAASLDRYLQAIDRPQIFGTTFSPDGATQEPYDTGLVPDALRRELGVPAVADQQEQMQVLLELLRQRAR